MIREFDPFVPVIDVDIATFDDAESDKPLVKLNAAITPVQAGSGTPAPDNVRAITGWTGAKATVTGKNLFDPSLFEDASAILKYVTLPIPNGTYTMSSNYPLNEGYADVFIFAGEASGGASTATNGVYLDQSRTITVTNGKYTVAYRIADIVNFEWQLEANSSATAYEAFGTVYPISWSDDAGTVYGGSINFTTGELIVTHKGIQLSSSDNWGLGSQNRFYLQLADAKQSDGALKTTIASTLASTDWNHLPDAAAGIAPIYGAGIGIHLTGVTTLDAFKTWLDSNSTFAVYELATPVTYELDPVEVKTLQDPGVNNVWVDTGKILELYYPIDISYFRRYFMVNSGYILLDGGDIDLTSTDPQLIVGSWDRIVTAMETGKPIWAFNTKYGTGKPLSPVPVFAWYLSATSIVIVGATLHIIVSNTDYCVVQDVASA